MILALGTLYFLIDPIHHSRPLDCNQDLLVSVRLSIAAPCLPRCLVSHTSIEATAAATFAMNEPGDPQSRLGFDIGSVGTNVYFDNILLRKGEAIPTTSSFSRESTPSSTSLRNYPNPVQTKTSFYYYLQESAQVSLKILKLYGNNLYSSMPSNLIEKLYQLSGYKGEFGREMYEEQWINEEEGVEDEEEGEDVEDEEDGEDEEEESDVDD